MICIFLHLQVHKTHFNFKNINDNVPQRKTEEVHKSQ